MDHFLTLVSSDDTLCAGHIEKLEKQLEDAGIFIVQDPEWLHIHKASDIKIADCLTISQAKKMRTLFHDDKIDIFCTSASHRRKKLFLADMDSTIVTSETLDELAEEAGLKEKISDITARAMRGEIDFFDALRERVSLLEGLPTDAIKRTLQATKISKGADILLNTLKSHHVYCVLVSGGFTFFTNDIAQQLGFDANHGNILDIQDNALTGKVIEPILDKEAKLTFLKDYTQKQKIDLRDTVAIGDGANDLPMLSHAGLGLGYHPKPLLEDSLINCIRHTDLTSVLYAQGYKQEEISQ